MNRPNIVFINTDQQRYDTLGCTGCAVAKTPNIDRLAEEGVRFDSCYTTHPVCMPARASWFTGQYPRQNGCWQNGVPLDPNADMIHTRLKQAGYHTGLIGKIHLDNVWARTEAHPNYGFDVLRECEGDPFCKDEYFHWLDAQDLYDDYMAQFKAGGHIEGYVRRLPEEKHMNNWIADLSAEYMRDRSRDGQPFFLSVGFFDPHHPFDPVEPYASMFDADDMPMPVYEEGEEQGMTPFAQARFKPEFNLSSDPAHIRRTIAAYHATITHVDAMVGRVMKGLQDAGLEENTIVIYTSDHGEMLGDHGILHKGPLFYEGATRVPLIWRFPKNSGVRGVDSGFASHVDFAPTVAALTGVEGPHLMQGRPLFDRELNRRPEGTPSAALTEWRERPFQSDEPYHIARCLRTERWKYVYHDSEGAAEPCGELYDLENDPNEHHNLWADPGHADVVRDMQDRLLNFIMETDPTPPRTDIF